MRGALYTAKQEKTTKHTQTKSPLQEKAASQPAQLIQTWFF
jgi:hypothetical protein